MPQAIYGGHTPARFNRATTFRDNRSGSGEILGRTKLRTSLQASYSWTLLKADWIREYWDDMQLAIEGEPFFIAWRPDKFPDVELALSTNAAQPTNMGTRSYMQVTLSAMGYGYE
jgi:hypothetical protein